MMTLYFLGLAVAIGMGVFSFYKCASLSRKLKRSEESKQKAEHLSHMKGLFLANVSHEIRTLLGSIMGFAELLKNDNLTSEERSQYLKIIQNAGSSLTDVINDILDLSKIESGHLNITKKDFSLPLLLEELRELLSFRAREKGIRLIFHLEAGLPLNLYSDPLRLKQILLNTLSNAIKFTNKGWVSLEARMSDKQVVFDIRDTGIGIPEKEKLEIFEPFKQSKVSHTRNFGGTGLGLPLSRHLAQLLGGDLVLISSQVGHGAHFQVKIKHEEVTLPLPNLLSDSQSKSRVQPLAQENPSQI